MSEFERCDVVLVQRNLAASRTRAQSLIKAGFVYAGGRQVAKPSQLIADSDAIEIRGEVCPYVSRGGFKLEKALKAFEIDPTGKVCLDVGASTGGFTDVLLRSGARTVYALDVGTSQLADVLRSDPRVVVMEQTNARTLTPDMFETAPELAVMDVSFISIRLIIPAIRKVLAEDGALAVLVKPQFEAGRQSIGKNGIVSDPKVHERVLQELINFAAESQWQVAGITYSPITGSDGNIEYLAYMKPGMLETKVFDAASIHAIVEEAHRAHR